MRVVVGYNRRLLPTLKLGRRGLFARLARGALKRVAAASGNAPAEAGRTGEDAAYWYLRERGFTMVARNYRARGGEVDLIGWEGGTLVFVEVKARTGRVRNPEDAVDRGKRRRLAAAARDYRRRSNTDAAYRFDVVSVLLQDDGEPEVEHFRDAFQEEQEA